jgi:hypothetical protein
MAETADAGAISSLAHSLEETLTGLGEPEFSRRSSASVLIAVGLPACPRDPIATAAAVVPAFVPLPCRLSTPELVELLKQPTCIGRACRVLLDQLQNRYRRSFADQWAFVRFA